MYVHAFWCVFHTSVFLLALNDLKNSLDRKSNQKKQQFMSKTHLPCIKRNDIGNVGAKCCQWHWKCWRQLQVATLKTTALGVISYAENAGAGCSLHNMSKLR